jgi:signal transduction histidine kinase
MARVVGEGVGAASSRVWLEREGRLWVAASWPPDADPSLSVPLEGASLPTLPGAEAAFAVEDRGDLLGALAVAMPASDPIDESKSKLVADLAAQAGLVLRNVRLTDELRRRLDDLKAAQKRLVTAQDEERRRIERNIHDGAQQQLVALSVRLRLAHALVGKDPDGAAAMLADLQGDTTRALEDLRDLARGIYPPLLADRGLPEALEAQARKSIVPVDVSTDGVSRYAPEVEAAAYFCVLEALQNVAKYAQASHVDVRLGRENGRLVFEVADDGVGFEPASQGTGSGVQGMRDRLSALDGVLEVRSAPGAGTVVVGRIPVTDRQDR